MSTDDGGRPPSATAAAPTCYRHAGRETYISCARCGRPICPECMVAAPVGFHCPECVREGRKSQRPARTVLGGRVAANRAAVTYSLIAINVVVFLIEQASPRFIDRFALLASPVRFVSGNGATVATYLGVSHGEYYRLFTAMFLHENVLHILFNMWALFVVGAPLEAMLGRARYVVLYLLAGLSGSALAYLLADPHSETVGASGAIFGLFGALFVLGRKLNLDIRPIALTIGINLVLTFSIPGISWQGHVGGLLAGAGLAAAWAYAPRERRTVVQFASSAVVAVVIVALVVARTHALNG
jgi:membrane associated rhomboid family serine protease